MNEDNKQQDKSKRYLIIIIIILLLMNGFFIYQYINTDRSLTTTKEELVDTESAKQELDKLLQESNEQLSLYKGRNSELDRIIEEKNKEIQNKALEIEDLLRRGKITGRELQKARNELDLLRYYVKKYNGQIDSLSRVNENLLKQNREMSQVLDTQKRKNENLAMRNITLENKMSLGKKLSFTKLEVAGINRRNSGRESETSRAKRVDLVRINFSLDVNYLADLGPKDVFLKVIGPEGNTLSSENLGGGMFRFQGEENMYTMKHTFDFDNTGQEITFYYDRAAEWEEGDYTIELYADGFLLSSEKLKLR